MKKLVVLVFAALAFSGLASASLIPVLDSVTGGGPLFTWSYTLHVSGDEQLNPVLTAGQCGTSSGPTQTCPSGTFFTIYDIFGLQGPIGQPAGWTNSVQLVGVTPTLQGGVSDNAALMNVTYFYTGPAAPTAASTTDLLQSPFTFQSNSNRPVQGFTTFNGTKFANPNGLDQGVNQVMVPGAPISAIPEPTSMLLIGGGLMGLAFLRRKLVH